MRTSFFVLEVLFSLEALGREGFVSALAARFASALRVAVAAVLEVRVDVSLQRGLRGEPLVAFVHNALERSVAAVA